MQTNKIIVHEENCTGCLICQLICSFTHKKTFNPSASCILIQTLNHSKKISFTSECNNCGLCAKYCLYKALERVDE
ncbi:MAG: hypothetical protein HWN67_09545 [Candidatus Helarchaeota archaeon]|nr:hypothetical protein [Candidatus Helarchaeota archaeon]